MIAIARGIRGSPQFLSALVTAILVLGACGGAPPEKGQAADRPTSGDSDKVAIVGFFGADEITWRYIRRILQSRGISPHQEGGFLRVLFVPRRDREVASGILASEEGLRGFLDWSRSDEGPEPPFEGVDVDLAYAEALARNPASTIVGKVLRSPDFPSPIPVDQVNRIVRVEWRVRPYVSERMEPTTAIQGRILYTRIIPRIPTKIFQGSQDVSVFEEEDE